MLRGAALHNNVPPDKWCVTQKDLRRFRKAVSLAIFERRIFPTQQDNFDPADDACGPNMYTVTEQYIKPKTHAAGDMSWALMLRPEGLQCDLFVSHAWLEGVFELINNLFHGWPNGLKNAWCCAFANPQNLDISTLIADPANSPFAIALRSASHVVVVSNSKIGIYSRLWCAYEAFLAYELDKSILVGHAPLTPDACRTLPWQLLLVVIVFILAFVVVPFETARFLSMKMFLLTGVCLIGLVIGRSAWWRKCNVAGVVAVSLGLGFGLRNGTPLFRRIVDDVWECDCTSPFAYEYVAILYCVVFVVFWQLSEVDRIRYDCLDKVADQLTKGYTGSVQDAACTDESDRKNIFDAIGGHIENVDHAISVLITSGMSSERLRRAADLGVNMVGATRFLWAGVFIWFALLFVTLPVQLIYCQWNTTRALSVSGCFWLPAWLLTYRRLRIDQRTFMIAATTKMAVATVFLRMVTVYINLHYFQPRFMWWFEQHVGFCLVFLVSVAGIDRVASWPICGPSMARFIAAKSFGAAISSYCIETDTGISEDDEDSSDPSTSNASNRSRRGSFTALE